LSDEAQLKGGNTTGHESLEEISRRLKQGNALLKLSNNCVTYSQESVLMRQVKQLNLDVPKTARFSPVCRNLEILDLSRVNQHFQEVQLRTRDRTTAPFSSSLETLVGGKRFEHPALAG